MQLKTATIAFGLTLAASTAFAQTDFAAVDTNGDGMLSMAEVQAMFGQEPAMAYLQTYDLNGDQMVTAAEITEHMMMMDDSMSDSMADSIDDSMAGDHAMDDSMMDDGMMDDSMSGG